MSDPLPPTTEIRFTPEFKRNLQALAKKYRRIRGDIDPIIAQLQRGERPGDQVPGTGLTIFKARVRNRDARRGKSGGYRIIYYLQTTTLIVLITLYSKSEQSDIEVSEIQRILAEEGSV